MQIISLQHDIVLGLIIYTVLKIKSINDGLRNFLIESLISAHLLTKCVNDENEDVSPGTIAPPEVKMPSKSRLFASDEELGKRDDDHKPSISNSWLPRRKLPAIRKRRIASFIAACVFIYFFIQNIPVLGPADFRSRQYGSTRYQNTSPGGEVQEATLEDPRRVIPPEAAVQGRNTVQQEIRDYDGPVRFYHLATSLHGIAHTSGHKLTNKNILFAASDLKSASLVIPLACEMARWKRNYVHMVFMGRDEVPLDDIKDMNGADEDACGIFWHDARPDYAVESSDRRMETSIAGALNHIEQFMHPQAVITANIQAEDDFFSRAIRAKIKDLKQTHIELPGEAENISWLARLNAVSLRAWHTASVDVVVQAPNDAAGSIIRMLQSLKTAYYDGFLPPRLIIELPQKVDEDTKLYVDNFIWPPRQFQGHLPNNQLHIRRRIPDKTLSSEEASIRFIESFYPSHAGNSHVLVLSAQVELSPIYYYYLKYMLLEYKYSTTERNNASSHLLGISLESPSIYLNGTAEFQPPTGGPLRHAKHDESFDAVSWPFLWQAPNSQATLYFSEMWLELHSFLSHRYLASKHSSTEKHHRERRKRVTEQYPAWMEYMLDLMRARGYYTLYPNLPTSSSSSSKTSGTSGSDLLAIVHNELYQLPEEFRQSLRPSQTDEAEYAPEHTSSILELPKDYLVAHHTSASKQDALNVERPLLKNLLPFLAPAPKSSKQFRENDDYIPASFPPLFSLPLLDYLGNPVSPREMQDSAEAISVGYRQLAGGCSEQDAMNNKREVVPRSADDLFCIDEPDLDDDFIPPIVTKAPTKKSSTQKSSIEEDSDLEVTDDDNERQPPRKTKPNAKYDDENEDDETPPPVKAAKPVKASTTTRVFGAQGVAATIDRVTNAANYEATARAGMKAKLEQGKAYDALPIVSVEESKLTDMERAELNDWKESERKSEADEAKKGTSERKATSEHDTAPSEDSYKRRIPIEDDDIARSHAGGDAMKPVLDPSLQGKHPAAKAERERASENEPSRSDTTHDRATAFEAAAESEILAKGGKISGRIRGWDEGDIDEGAIAETQRKPVVLKAEERMLGKGRKTTSEHESDAAGTAEADDLEAKPKQEGRTQARPPYPAGEREEVAAPRRVEGDGKAPRRPPVNIDDYENVPRARSFEERE